GLAPHLPEPLKGQACQQALNAAHNIEDEENRAKALTGLAPHLPVDLLPKALDAAQAIENKRYRAEALIGLAPHLPEPLRGQACQQALEAAQAIGGEENRAEALIGLAPHLAVDLMPQALAAAPPRQLVPNVSSTCPVAPLNSAYCRVTDSPAHTTSPTI